MTITRLPCTVDLISLYGPQSHGYFLLGSNVISTAIAGTSMATQNNKEQLLPLLNRLVDVVVVYGADHHSLKKNTNKDGTEKDFRRLKEWVRYEISLLFCNLSSRISVQ